MKTIWIIGAGKFGLLAVHRLTRFFPGARFTIIDALKKNLFKAHGVNRTLINADGVHYLRQNLLPDRGPDWIVPALPVHLLAEWLLASCKAGVIRRTDVPDAAMEQLPNAFRGTSGDVYVSHADFICPDDCPEPRNRCFFTGLERNRNMFDLLKDIQIPGWRSLVARSRQLTPGVGGYRPEQLFSVYNQAIQTKSPILLSTACRCHGVITALEPKIGSGVSLNP